MKRWLALAALLLPTSLAAANGFDALMDSRRVDQVLTLRLAAGEKTFEYSIDDGTYRDLEGVTFSTGDQIDIAWHGYNPLEERIESNLTDSEDSTYTVLKKFLDELVATIGVTTGLKPGEPEMTPEDGAKQYLVRGAPAPPASCQQYDILRGDLTRLSNAVDNAVLPKRFLPGLTSRAAGLEGVRDVRRSLSEQISTYDETLRLIDEVPARLNEQLRIVIADTTCPELRAKTLDEIPSALLEVLTQRKRIARERDALAGVRDALAPFAADSAWRRDGTSYIFTRVLPTFQTMKTVNVTRKPLAWNEDGDKLQEGDGLSTTFDVRRYSSWIPDLGAALIYSEIEYPTWGTEPCGDDKLCVVQGENGRHPLEGALVLNWFYKSKWQMPFHVGAQIGVSSAKDFPGFLAGAAIRFNVARKLALMGGRMMTWHKVPDTLSAGSEIENTTELESDLELKRSPSAWYFGAQFNF